MKLSVTRYQYEPPALTVVAETEYEAAVLHRYWETAELYVGKGDGVDGFSYGIKFAEPRKEPAWK